MDANGILERTVRTGGCTLDASTLALVHPRDYWTVGGDTRPTASFAYSQDDTLASSRMADALCRVLGSYDALAYRPAYIGTWVDDSVVYVDAVTLHASREDALAVAFVRGEQAIYNLATGETVRYGQGRPE